MSEFANKTLIELGAMVDEILSPLNGREIKVPILTESCFYGVPGGFGVAWGLDNRNADYTRAFMSEGTSFSGPVTLVELWDGVESIAFKHSPDGVRAARRFVELAL